MFCLYEEGFDKLSSYKKEIYKLEEHSKDRSTIKYITGKLEDVKNTAQITLHNVSCFSHSPDQDLLLKKQNVCEPYSLTWKMQIL